MPKTFATLVDEIAQELQDTAHATWTDTAVTGELPILLEKAIREFSDYFPRIVKYTFKLESRTGTTSSYLNTWLVDADSEQFTPTSDVGKVVHNKTTTAPSEWAASTAYTKGTRISPTVPNGRRYICSTAGTSSTTEPTWPTTIDGTVTDGTVTWMHRGLITDPTWAEVLSSGSNSGTQLNLSKDIMADDEDYEIFNKGCWSNKQIYLGDIIDYVGEKHGVVKVEYKTQKADRDFKTFTVEGDILTIDMDSTPPDSADSDSDVDVFVWIKRKHQVTQQTITTLYIHLPAGYASGATSITVDYDGGTVTGTIKAGTDITLDNMRGTYILTADATFSGNNATLAIYPGLESNVADDNTVRITKSTFDTKEERLIVELTAARALISKGTLHIGTVNVGGMQTWRNFQDAGRDKLGIVLTEIRGMMPLKTKRRWSTE